MPYCSLGFFLLIYDYQFKTYILLWFVLAICMCYFWIWCTCVLFLPWYYGCKKICLDLSAQKYIIICIPWRLTRLRWYKKLLQRRIPILCQNTSNNRKTSPLVHLGSLGSSSNSIKQSDSDIWKKRSIYLSSLWELIIVQSPIN